MPNAHVLLCAFYLAKSKKLQTILIYFNQKERAPSAPFFSTADEFLHA